jgi:hypothetical protein
MIPGFYQICWWIWGVVRTELQCGRDSLGFLLLYDGIIIVIKFNTWLREKNLMGYLHCSEINQF